jgi:phosphomannomutase/phosphoglucomutase
MVTASHNDNGWTGVKIGIERPLTHGPDEIGELRERVLSGELAQRPGGGYVPVPDLFARYVDDLASGPKLSRKLRAVVAAGADRHCRRRHRLRCYRHRIACHRERSL